MSKPIRLHTDIVQIDDKSIKSESATSGVLGKG